ncbi:hypothetical protein Gohar_019490 [Gossypium harknessii]|uniref:Uncharacterized protein n=1 Tax=Gossypium harknessii TaxID=34285 RepID=A0A7J9ICJ8_9ROSI|nr:hypothetical protein [Gossypium harknessii]
MKKRVDIFTLSIYGLVIFPKALGHIDEAVTELFNRLDKRVTPVLGFWQKHSVTSRKLIRFRIGSSLKIIHH